jgi:hypothetical protein
VLRRCPCTHRRSDLPLVSCPEAVSVTLPCGHTHNVTCAEGRRLLADPGSCSTTVELLLPCCGHKLKTSCNKAAAVVLDPTCCKHTCELTLPGCMHSCSSSCGSCAEHNMPVLLSSFVAQAAAEPDLQAAAQILQGAQKQGWPTVFQILTAGPPATAARAGASSASSSTADTVEGAAGTGAGWDAAVQKQLHGRWVALLQQLQVAVRGSQSSSAGGARPGTPAADSSSTSDAKSSSSSSSQGTKKKGPLGTLLDSFGRTRASARAAAAAAAAKPAATTGSSSGGNSSSSGAAQAATGDTSSGPPPQLPEGFTLQHSGCAQKCERDLACGHRCSSTCHKGKPCPPCKTQCPVSCGHSRCRNTCIEPCAPCAEPCTWKCSHQGSCSLPCGAPCDR